MLTIISSTNRKNSNTESVAAYYQKKITEKGVPSRVFALTELPIDLIGHQLKGATHPGMEAIQLLMKQTTKFLFVIPEYNGSFPGVLKTFIDYCSREIFSGKKAALVGISSGRYGNVRGVEHFTGICNYIGLEVMPLKIHITNVVSELNGQKDLYKEDTLKFTNQQIEQFIGF